MTRLSRLPTTLHKYIHPTFRVPLLRGQKKRRRLVKRKPLHLILRKYILLDVKPRIPPLHCARCGLVTRLVSTISSHDCNGNIFHWRGPGGPAHAEFNTLGDDEITEEMMAAGGRNAAKRDGMAILERFARPQNVVMYSIKYSEPRSSIPAPTGKSVPSLSELVTRVLAPPRSVYPSLPSDQVFEQRSVPVVSQRRMGKNVRDGHLCRPCGRLFASFDDYDVHLEPTIDEKGEDTNPCRKVLPNPIPVQLNDCGNAPAEYDFSSRRLKVKGGIRKASVDSCTGCGMEGFESTLHFHTHIMECATRMEYERIEEAINKRRHLLHKV